MHGLQKRICPDVLLNEQITGIVGQENFFYDEARLSYYTTASIPHSAEIRGVIKPQTTDEIVRLVATANRFKMPLYPVSRGRNWGYGSALPVQNGCFILDLSRMNRILEVNESLGYAVIEPGVTQMQLFEHLERTKSRLQIDPSGAGPNTSILGNIVERGYGIGLYSDHFASSCGMQVVLGNGEVLETNFGQFENARARHIYKWGIGPSLDGIFTQSNFGIVTKIAVWLQKSPEACEVICFGSNDPLFPGKISEILRELFFDGCFPASCNVVSRNRVLTTKMQYPWELMGGKTPLSGQVAAKLGEKAGIKLWNGFAPLFGTRECMAAARKVIKKRLQPHTDRLFFLSDTNIGTLNRFRRILSKVAPFDINSVLFSVNPLARLLKGEPVEISLPTPYWRNRNAKPGDTNRDSLINQCGLIWITPLVPMIKEQVNEFIALAERIVSDYRFEFCPGFTAVSHRVFDCTLPILFDKQDGQESARARECNETLLHYFMMHGFIPYRAGVQSMSKITEDESTFWNTVVKIKSVLDPNNVVSPGRYCPVEVSD